jgi:NRAMP (natural resistance-associated macrophage protein)-like metal ion transporter
MSNIFAIFLQSLCIKLGSVTGMNLAENCKANLPPWLNIVLYVFAEAAIIATDIAEVRYDTIPTSKYRLTRHADEDNRSSALQSPLIFY